MVEELNIKDIDINKILEGATIDQQKAICHKDTHARLLAGPGTGKTFVLTKKVLWLILNERIDPKDILSLTFTRLAAAQLKNDLKKALTPYNLSLPVVSTLHSFALKQILYNSGVIAELPRPIRIADDWEERNLIQEDIKKNIQASNIKEVQGLINRLSADWEQLRAEEAGWQESFPNPKFLGSLNQHRSVYGETMRAELVYKLKKSLEQNGDFRLDNNYKYVLIDEYQDLNACDLSVIRYLSENGAKLFVVGDDDQSIYGFRYANPAGIRQFPEVYDDALRLDLETCYRCDKEILKQAEFVASQDFQRLPKKTKPRVEADEGEVVIVRYANQDREAAVVALKIKDLIDRGLPEEKIVILSRSAAILGPIKTKLSEQGIRVSGSLESEFEDSNEFRVVLSVLRLLANRDDSLAWRTLFELEKNHIGIKGIDSIESIASGRGIRFSSALQEIKANETLSQFGGKIKSYTEKIEAEMLGFSIIDNLSEKIRAVIDRYVADDSLKIKIYGYFSKLSSDDSNNLEEIIRGIGINSDEIEQETEAGSVSVLTMHKAKGLTFDVCFIVGAEDEFLPGRNDGEFIGDERRLLYVSMTRAKHKLYISYCNKRTGQQRFFGRVQGGQEKRSLTRFFKDAKIRIVAVN